MGDAGSESRRGKPGRKKGKSSEKARKAKATRRGGKPDSKRRVALISAIAHPLRRRILRLISNWGRPISPIKVARELRVPIGTIGYHMRILWELDAVEPAGEEQVRGAVEHFYDSTIEDDPPIESLLEETREADEREAEDEDEDEYEYEE